MSINLLVLKSLKKNLTSYYLYVFALIFSVALYFAFVTLQYDPSMALSSSSIRAAAGLKAASVLLIAIVAIFLVYANNLFIKRRSKEIGLYQLIGITKVKVFRMLTTENLILYFGALLAGCLIGFSFSRLVTMILFAVTGVEAVASLHFSLEALYQTLFVFGAIFVIILLLNYIFIKRQTILGLFQTRAQTESRVRTLSTLSNLVGILGLAFIVLGYYLSSILFSTSGIVTSFEALLLTMLTILASVILGIYLFYRGSVAFIANLIRRRKDGYLNVKQVLSLSSLMFRMKSHALLLTIITTISALTIGLLSLSYITYYSAEKMAKSNLPAHFSFIDAEDALAFKRKLENDGIHYSEVAMDVIRVEMNIEQLLKGGIENIGLNMGAGRVTSPVISDRHIDKLDLADNEIIFSGSNDLIRRLMPLEDQGEIELLGLNTTIKQNYLGLADEFYISYYFTGSGLLAIVNDTTFEQLRQDINPDIQGNASYYIGIDILDKAALEQANQTFQSLSFQHLSQSQLDLLTTQKQSVGLVMFIVGFLGLAFLITSGCILYFKQMDESDEELAHYTILRKLGFTVHDILAGIKIKQCFTFGIPLSVGLLHSYFAVQSGWFLFGTEVWTPMLIVMGLYTALYSSFGILSVLYSKKVIKHAL